MSDLTKFLIKAYIRKILTALGAILITRGVLLSGTAESFAGQYTEEVAGFVLIAGSAIWTFFYQWYVKRKVVAAIEASPNIRPEQLEAKVKL